MNQSQFDKSLAEEQKHIGDLKRRFVSPTPEFQKKMRLSPAEAEASVALAWHRGLAKGRGEIFRRVCKELKKAGFTKAVEHLKQHCDI